MNEKIIISLVDMEPGQSGRIVQLATGAGLSRRLEAMGVRMGKMVIKVSGIPLRGPVVIQIGGTRAGLGHGMARKIMVEIIS